MSTQATVVVFDLGNVLITWDRRLLYRRIFATEAALERFLEEVYTMEANERFDRGQPLEEFTAELAAAHPEHADAVLALRDRWIETIGPVIDGSVEVLRELLGHGVRCFALSNWNAETFALVEPHHAFLGWFEGMVLSGREGMVKPEPGIYRLLCDRHGFAPADALFVDDAPKNVEAARAVGMDAVLFTGPAALREALVGRGLLPARG